MENNQDKQKILKEKKQSAPYSLPLKLQEILVGSLLGDGSLSTNTDQATTCSFIFTSKVRPYIDHLRNIFDPWTNQKINIIASTGVSNFSTLSLSAFSIFKDFYIFSERDFSKKTKSRKKIKILPSNIEELLTPLAITYWYMDDGYIAQDSHGTHFATESFTEQEVDTLCFILNKKYNLECYKRRKKSDTTGIIGYRIYVPAASYSKMRELIFPDLLNCFYYKLHLDINGNQIW